MRIFDPHIHMTSRTTDDYERDVRRRRPRRWSSRRSGWASRARASARSPTTSTRSSGWEPFRASQFGIAHHCTIALNPKEANDPRCREVLDVLPRYLAKDGVVAVGEIGYDSMTAGGGRGRSRAQLALAVEHELPALVHTPHRDKLAGHPAHPRRRRASRASRPARSSSTTSTR